MLTDLPSEPTTVAMLQEILRSRLTLPVLEPPDPAREPTAERPMAILKARSAAQLFAFNAETCQPFPRRDPTSSYFPDLAWKRTPRRSPLTTPRPFASLRGISIYSKFTRSSSPREPLWRVHSRLVAIRVRAQSSSSSVGFEQGIHREAFQVLIEAGGRAPSCLCTYFSVLE